MPISKAGDRRLPSSTQTKLRGEMRMKRFMFIALMFLTFSNVYAGRKRGTVNLCNLDFFDEITVTWEYVHEDAVQVSFEERGYASWSQDIGGAVVDCVFFSRERNERNFAVIKPGEKFCLIGYYIHWRDVNTVETIPLIKQLRSIYKKLEIRFPDGSIITLDTVGTCMARKWAGAGFDIQICHPKYTVMWKPVEEI